jgi:hypothetical protein
MNPPDIFLPEFMQDPYPLYKRMRDEHPWYKALAAAGGRLLPPWPGNAEAPIHACHGLIPPLGRRE